MVPSIELMRSVLESRLKAIAEVCRVSKRRAVRTKRPCTAHSFSQSVKKNAELQPIKNKFLTAFSTVRIKVEENFMDIINTRVFVFVNRIYSRIYTVDMYVYICIIIYYHYILFYFILFYFIYV